MCRCAVKSFGRRFAPAVLWLAWVAPMGLAANADKAPKELVQYIQDAKKLGLKDEQIKRNAVTAGWEARTVEETLAYVRSLRQKPAAAAEPAAATPAPAGVAPQPAPADNAATPAEPVAPAAAPIKERGVPEGYQIGAGDVLQISVWKEPDVSVPSVVVRPDGKVAMPLLKEIEVLGMTPTEAEQAIAGQLAKFIHGPEVTVVVKEIHSKKIFVVGAVKKEGPIALQYRMSVLQALSEAGGLTDYAKRKKIYVLRTENGKQYRFPFNYDAVIKGEQMEQNIWVAPNDTIVVPH